MLDFAGSWFGSSNPLDGRYTSAVQYIRYPVRLLPSKAVTQQIQSTITYTPESCYITISHMQYNVLKNRIISGAFAFLRLRIFYIPPRARHAREPRAPPRASPRASPGRRLPGVCRTPGITTPEAVPRYADHSDTRGMPDPPPCAGYRM